MVQVTVVIKINFLLCLPCGLDIITMTKKTDALVGAHNKKLPIPTVEKIYHICKFARLRNSLRAILYELKAVQINLTWRLTVPPCYVLLAL